MLSVFTAFTGFAENKMRKRYLFLFLFLAGLSFARFASAATAFFSPASGTFAERELPVDILIDTEGVAVNNVNMTVKFPNDLLEVASVSANDSVFSMWVGAPKYSNELGTITFTAGVPNPGFTGETGQILSVLFRVKNQGTATLTFSNVSVRANDGYGTNVYRDGTKAVYTLNPAPFYESDRPRAPIFTEYPHELVTGDHLILHGLAGANNAVTLWVQKSGSDEESFDFASDTDGRFLFSYDKTVTEGVYRVWAEAKGSLGLASPPSEKISIEVKHPAIDRRLVIGGSIILLILFGLTIAWWTHKQSRKRIKKETLEAESSVHKAFGSLRENRARLEMFEAARSKRTLTAEEEKIVAWLKKDLDHLEDDVEKEIIDIEKEVK